MINNSVNCHICTGSLYFEELHLFTHLEKEMLGSIGTIRDSVIPEGFGNIQLVWKDNNGIDHEYLVEDIFCIPTLSANLLGVTKFGKQIEPKDEAFLEGTNIQAFMNYLVFT